MRSAASACRRRVAALMMRFPPRLAAARALFEVVWRPKRRPPRQKTVEKHCWGRSGLRFGQFPGVWVARAHCRAPGQGGSNPTATLRIRTLTPEYARKPLDTHVNPSTCTWAALPTRIPSGPHPTYRAHVRVVGPTCELSGPRATCRDPHDAESRRESWIRYRGSDHAGQWERPACPNEVGNHPDEPCNPPGQPTRATHPQRKATSKEKRARVKGVTSLHNVRKWRVCAGCTVELLR